VRESNNATGIAYGLSEVAWHTTRLHRSQVPTCDNTQARRDYQDLLRECDGLTCEGTCTRLFRARFVGCLRGFEPFFRPEDRGEDADGALMEKIVRACVGPPLPTRSVTVRLGILLSTCVPHAPHTHNGREKKRATSLPNLYLHSFYVPPFSGSHYYSVGSLLRMSPRRKLPRRARAPPG
jgi:hypothetical protein